MDYIYYMYPMICYSRERVPAMGVIIKICPAP
jgi:hypothetical protein